MKKIIFIALLMLAAQFGFSQYSTITYYHFKSKIMKKLIPIIIVIIALFMPSCSRYTNGGGGGCGVWYPKKYTGTYTPKNTSWRGTSGVH